MKSKLKEARLRKEASSTSSEIYDEKGRKVVVLTETDSKGFTRPVKNNSQDNYSRKKKTETHEGNKRVRYFADDDKYSLNDMVRCSMLPQQNISYHCVLYRILKNYHVLFTV